MVNTGNQAYRVESASTRNDNGEVGRLKREIEEARQRLEEEVAYYKAELEGARQRSEQHAVRFQAEEVARRRRAEEQVAKLKGELHEAQESARQARTAYDGINRKYEQLKADADQRIRQQVAAVRSEAKASWQQAEGELHRVEAELTQTQKELARTREQLDTERKRSASLKHSLDTARSRASKQAGVSGPDDDSLKLIASLKKALWAAAKARRQAEIKLAQMEQNLQKRPAEVSPEVVQAPAVEHVAQPGFSSDPAAKPGPSSAAWNQQRKRLEAGSADIDADAGRGQFGDANADEALMEKAWDSVSLGSMELSDEFQMMSNDESVEEDPGRAFAEAAAKVAEAEFSGGGLEFEFDLPGEGRASGVEPASARRAEETPSTAAPNKPMPAAARARKTSEPDRIEHVSIPLEDEAAYGGGGDSMLKKLAVYAVLIGGVGGTFYWLFASGLLRQFIVAVLS